METKVLNPTRVFMLVCLLFAMIVYVFIVRYRPFEGIVHANLFYVISGGLALLVAGILVFKTSNMLTSLNATALNMFVEGNKGAMWDIICSGLILAFTLPRFPIDLGSIAQYTLFHP
jgi:hypothetical protein